MRKQKNPEAQALNIWIPSSRGEAHHKFDVAMFSWIPNEGPKCAVVLPAEISSLTAYVSSYSTIVALISLFGFLYRHMYYMAI